MSKSEIDDNWVDNEFHTLAKARQVAWHSSIVKVAALAERIRLEVILDKSMRRSRKRWFAAYADYLDDVVEEREKTESGTPDGFRENVLAYVRDFLNDADRDS